MFTAKVLNLYNLTEVFLKEIAKIFNPSTVKEF